jgi:glutaminyl-peptide cyclotransferase
MINIHKHMAITRILFFMITFLISACNDASDTGGKTSVSIPAIHYAYCKSYPHDTTSFTEGFLIHGGELYESTGATGDLPQTRSLFGTVDLMTGKINRKVELDREKYFGEGIAFLNGKVFQLTYKTKVGFIYDGTTFEKTSEFTFPSKEGWGMTTDGKSLIMSDGTNTITFLDPNTLQVIKTIAVSENGYVKEHLNELEYIKGYIYANIWATNTIVKIDPENGAVVGALNLTSLADEVKSIYPGSLEMNGIAYDSIADKVLVTGKLWPKIYEIKIN